MFTKKSLFVATACVFCGLLGVSAANAADSQCYTAESVAGSWAVLGTYGANVAWALGERTVAADGGFTGTFLVNAPTVGSPTGARTIITGTQVGTYTVNCDGTGTVTRYLTASSGVVTTQTDDFIITKATVKGGHLIATVISDASEVPSALVPGGIFLTRVHTRLPDSQDRHDDDRK
jgi:hypothetical protein